jgi:aspartate kinase
MDSTNNTIVLKFGGAAVATPEHFSRIADLIIGRLQQGYRVAVVVSAMGGMTDHLISLAHQVHPNPPRREYDMLVSVGERISIALLAMALAKKGYEAVSFTGSQSGIITSEDHSEARILDVRPHRLSPVLMLGKIVIVAGFQGVSVGKEITTLGRGGSDTTAVALGIALNAAKVVFYKDVPGIFDRDPKKYCDATPFQVLTYGQAQEIVDRGAKVLHPRSIQLAERNGIPLEVVSFLESGCQGTVIAENDSVRRAQPIFESPQTCGEHAVRT